MNIEYFETLIHNVKNALDLRLPLLDTGHEGAFRLFNGFTEGAAGIAVDLYAKTLLIYLHDISGEAAEDVACELRDYYLRELPWLQCVILKQRALLGEAIKKGEIMFGREPDSSILENGIKYAFNPLLNQDAGFYLDTRNLRSWLADHADGKEVLNTFAYTGSLGVAALAGGAARVVQVDLSAKFLELARRSAMQNHLDLGRMKLVSVDFFVAVNQMKNRGERYDILILDPPFFSVTNKGTVNLVSETSRLINKVRPLVRDGGKLVIVNNALFLSGQEFLNSLQVLGKDGYLSIEEQIQVPDDVAGMVAGIERKYVADPLPFNHPTKIVVLEVKHKTNS